MSDVACIVDDGEAERAALRTRLQGSNINPDSLLATDYLNHFNEVVMLLGLLADMPECLDDLRGWEPLSYPQHFLASSLSDRLLAVEAYGLSPSRYREPFDYAVRRMDKLVLRAVAEMDKSVGDAVPAIALATATALQRLIDVASSLIHGRDEPLHQDEIDKVIAEVA